MFFSLRLLAPHCASLVCGSVAVGGGVEPGGFVLDEFDEQGDDGVGEGDPEHGAATAEADVVGAVADANQVEEKVVHDGVGDEYGHDGGVFAADEGFPGELEHAAFEERPFRDERGHPGGPILEFVAVFGAQERFFGHHDAFVVDPIDKGDDEEYADVHREDEQTGPDEVVGEVERVAHHGVDAFGVEVVGDLSGGVAAGGAFWGGADGVGAQDEACKGERGGEDGTDDHQGRTPRVPNVDAAVCEP